MNAHMIGPISNNDLSVSHQHRRHRHQRHHHHEFDGVMPHVIDEYITVHMYDDIIMNMIAILCQMIDMTSTPLL